MSQRRAIVTAASLLLLGNLASRVLGLLREQVIAGFFGATAVTSAFQTASTVPTAFYDLVVGGAVSAALIPVLSGYAESDDPDELGRVVGTLLTGAALVLAVLVAILLLAAAPLTSVLGVAPWRDIYPTTLSFVRIVVPALFFLGLAGVAGAVCYARRWFTYPAVSIALFNGGLVATTFLFHRQLGGTSLVVGVLIGAVLQLAAVAPGLRGVPVRVRLDVSHPAVRRIIRLYAPVAAGLIVTEVAVLIDRNLAWRTGDESAAIMRFATTLIQLPLGLVATATSLAVLPLLSRLADEPDEFGEALGTGLRLALIAIIPAAAFLVVFAEPVVRLLFQRGAFDAAATEATVRAFRWYAPQLPFVAIDQLLVYAFYARRNTLTPMLVGLGGVGVYLAGALVMIGPLQLGLSGLILANTLQNSLHAVVLLALLWRGGRSLGGFGVAATVGRAGLAGLAAALVGLGAIAVARPPTSALALAGYLVAAGLVLVAVYLGALHLLRVEEATSLPTLLRARLTASGLSGR